MRNFLKPLLFSALLCATLPLGGQAPHDATEKRRAVNVILFLGDGTGLPTVHASSLLGHGKPQALYVHSMPHLGLAETSTASSWVTDSAAGMTAIMTGRKTHTGVVAQSASARRGVRDGAPLKTVLEYAEELGLSTGVVSNSSITDATPAACYAHSNDRGKWGEIFRQVVQPRFGDGVDVMIGAGRNRILRETAKLNFDVPSELRAKGYEFLDQPATLHDVAGRARRLVALYQGKPWDIPLAEAVDTALEVLRRNPKGFFLMVESNNHFEDIRRSLDLMLAFDGIISRTAEKMRDTDTLILFTADHSYDILLAGDAPIGEDILPHMRVQGDHTAEEVLVMAQGPGADKVHGFFPNTRLFHIILSAYGWRPDGDRLVGDE